jgi:hypothetical protein
VGVTGLVVPDRGVGGGAGGAVRALAALALAGQGRPSAASCPSCSVVGRPRLAWWWGDRAVPPSLGPLEATALLVQGNVDPFGRAVSAAQELDVHLTITELGVSAMAARPTW